VTDGGGASSLANKNWANGSRGWLERTMKIVASLGVMWFSLSPALAQTCLNWPQTIELLAQGRTQAETRVETLKTSSEKAAIATGLATEPAAKHDNCPHTRSIRSSLCALAEGVRAYCT
jgi:hypothetical protein